MDDDNWQPDKRRNHKLCSQCRKRPAKHNVKGGKYKYDKQHDLCGQCYRSAADRAANTN